MEPSKLFASRLVVTEQINNIPVHTVLVPVPVDVCEAASSNPGDECVLKGSVSSNAVRVAGNVVVNGKVSKCSLYFCHLCHHGTAFDILLF